MYIQRLPHAFLIIRRCIYHLKHENHHSTTMDLFKKISIYVIVILLMLGISLGSAFAGFERGYEVGSKSGWYLTGGTAYGYLSQNYFKLTVIWAVYLVGEKITTRWLSKTICLLSLLLTFFPYRQIYFQKIVYVNQSELFGRLIQNTIALDFISVFLVLALFIYQVVSMSQYVLRKSIVFPQK